jgi:hypothetical protein
LVAGDFKSPNDGLPFGEDLVGSVSIYASILPATASGDQTVPAKSADYQLNSGIFKGVFRQNGYEHQSSYKDTHAIASTLYSIVRIAQGAKWKSKGDS